MIVTTYVSAILVFALWIPAKTNAPIITFAALYGFSSGAFVSMAPALVAQFSDIKKIGVRNGTLFAIISVAALVGNPIAGALIAQENGFLHLQVFCGALLMAGSTGFVFARSSIVGWAARKKV